MYTDFRNEAGIKFLHSFSKTLCLSDFLFDILRSLCKFVYHTLFSIFLSWFHNAEILKIWVVKQTCLHFSPKIFLVFFLLWPRPTPKFPRFSPRGNASFDSAASSVLLIIWTLRRSTSRRCRYANIFLFPEVTQLFLVHLYIPVLHCGIIIRHKKPMIEMNH